MSVAEIMFQTRMDQARTERRHAIHKLRIGDRISHRSFMQGARFFLMLARQWRPK